MKTNEVFDTFKMLLSCVDFDKFYNQSNFLPEEIIIEFIDSIKDKNQIIIHQSLSPRCIDVLIDKVNQIKLIQYQQLTESQIKHLTNKNKLLWNIICQFQSISYDFILDNIDNLKWENVIKYQKHLSETFIEEHQEELKNYWNLISQYQVLSEDFIRKHICDVYWNLISQYQVLSEDFIRKHICDVYWSFISQYQVLSESFIEEYIDRLDWKIISQYQVLSEDFIYKFRGLLNWIKILSNQNISEEFFYKVEDFIPWDSDIISRYVFSLKFLNHYKNKLNWEIVYWNENQPLIPFEEFDKIADLIDWDCISTNKNLNEEFIDHYRDRLNWNLISRYYNCSEDFIRKNKDKVSWYYIENYQNVSNEFLEEFHNYLRGI